MKCSEKVILSPPGVAIMDSFPRGSRAARIVPKRSPTEKWPHSFHWIEPLLALKKKKKKSHLFLICSFVLGTIQMPEERPLLVYCKRKRFRNDKPLCPICSALKAPPSAHPTNSAHRALWNSSEGQGSAVLGALPSMHPS